MSKAELANNTDVQDRSVCYGSLGEFLRMLGWVSLYSTSIGVLLYVLGLSEPLSFSIGVSLVIGWCIGSAHWIIEPLIQSRIGLVGSSAVATAVGLGIAIGLITIYVNQNQIRLEQLNLGSAIIALFFGVLGSVVFTNLSRLLRMREELSAAEVQRLAAERALVDAQLKTLQAQIEPHFLFNTLSTAMSLIHTQPNAAEEVLQQLTRLLRNSLSRTREQNTTLDQELSLVKAYLRINQIRMGARLKFEICCAPELAGASLPPLLVQPLVENAITHGLEPCEAGGSVVVAVSSERDVLRVTISDTGLGLEQAGSSGGTGTGLANVRERLRSLYGEHASLRITPNQPSGAIAVLSLPLDGDD